MEWRLQRREVHVQPSVIFIPSQTVIQMWRQNEDFLRHRIMWKPSPTKRDLKSIDQPRRTKSVFQTWHLHNGSRNPVAQIRTSGSGRSPFKKSIGKIMYSSLNEILVYQRETRRLNFNSVSGAFHTAALPRWAFGKGGVIFAEHSFLQFPESQQCKWCSLVLKSWNPL